ncbi:MAG: hypothetical protein R3F42_08850 [Pseudomonadota bacterium]
MKVLFILLAAGTLLAGCSDPEQDAQKALTEVKADWFRRSP